LASQKTTVTSFELEKYPNNIPKITSFVRGLRMILAMKKTPLTKENGNRKLTNPY
jgi:hypothetical protein